MLGTRGNAVRSWVRVALTAALASLVLLTVLAPTPAPAGTTDPSPVRIAFLGDSITQGSAGDWTWRWFAWRHLVADHVAVDLTGDRDDLWDASVAGEHAYADSAFDADHDATWGDSWTGLTHPVPQLMAAQHPDVLVVLLGLNDLSFYGETPARVLDQVHQAVDQARAADPHVKLVLSHLTAWWIAGVTDFNALLDAAAPGWSTADSPIAVATPDVGLTQSTSDLVADTWDEKHPSASGEQRIAAAICDALAALGIGTPYPRPLPWVPLGPRTPAVLSGTASEGAVDLSWAVTPGVTTQRVWVRDVTAGTPAVMRGQVAGTATRVDGLTNGHEYALDLQPVKGYVPAESDVRSNTLQLVPRAFAPAAPTGLAALAASHAVTATWHATGGSARYRLWWRTASPRSGWAVRETTSTTATITSLVAGAPYELRVQGVSATGTSGPASAIVTATPTGPRPAAPGAVTAGARRGGLVTVRWRASASATHYLVYRRDVSHHRAWQVVRTATPVTTTVLRVGAQRRGTVYAFAVRSMHQLVVGGTSLPVRVCAR